jgi:hypothetical protein
MRLIWLVRPVIVTAVGASIIATRIIPAIVVAVSPQVFHFLALTFDLAALLLNLISLSVLSLPLALHLITNCRATQGAERATDQRAFAGVVAADRAANERASAGAQCATAQSPFFSFAEGCSAPSQQESEAKHPNQSFHEYSPPCLIGYEKSMSIGDYHFNPPVLDATSGVVRSISIRVRSDGVLLAVALRRQVCFAYAVVSELLAYGLGTVFR